MSSWQRPIWLTAINDVDHAVLDEDMAAGIAAGSGKYSALCGAVVLAASLLAPPGPRCPHCVACFRPAAVKRATDGSAGRPVRTHAVLSHWLDRFARMLAPVVSSRRGVSPVTASAFPETGQPVTDATGPPDGSTRPSGGSVAPSRLTTGSGMPTTDAPGPAVPQSLTQRSEGQ